MSIIKMDDLMRKKQAKLGAVWLTLQRTNTESLKQILPEKELRSPNFHIHVKVSDLYIPAIDLPILLQEICGPIVGI
jgi:hypothetical protein